MIVREKMATAIVICRFLGVKTNAKAQKNKIGPWGQAHYN